MRYVARLAWFGGAAPLSLGSRERRRISLVATAVPTQMCLSAHPALAAACRLVPAARPSPRPNRAQSEAGRHKAPPNSGIGFLDALRLSEPASARFPEPVWVRSTTGITRKSRQWIDGGFLPAIRIGRRVRITRSEFDALQQNRTGNTAKPIEGIWSGEIPPPASPDE
jgi:hypothetical protein